MAIVMMRTGMLFFLAAKISYKLPAINSLSLFTNNVTPTNATPINAYVEPTAAWYSRKGLNTWSAPFINASGNAQTNGALCVWTPTNTSQPQQVYGYFVTDAAFTTVYWAERNPAGPTTVGATLVPFVIQVVMGDGQLGAP